jgi:hypothetical protein
MWRYPALGTAVPLTDHRALIQQEGELLFPDWVPSQSKPAPFHPARCDTVVNLRWLPRIPNIPDALILANALDKTSLTCKRVERLSLEYLGDRGLYPLVMRIMDTYFAHKRGRKLSNDVQQTIGHRLLSNESLAVFCKAYGLQHHVVGLTEYEKENATVGLLAGTFEGYIGGLMEYDELVYGPGIWRRTIDYLIRLFHPYVLPHLEVLVDFLLEVDDYRSAKQQGYHGPARARFNLPITNEYCDYRILHEHDFLFVSIWAVSPTAALVHDRRGVGAAHRAG